MGTILKTTTNKRSAIKGWCMYDWANSVYNLTITTAIFPGYFDAVVHKTFSNNYIPFLGFSIENSSLFSFLLSTAFLSIILLNLVLSGISDHFNIKKVFLRFFSTIGAISCSLLYFFDHHNFWLGCVLFILATIGYAGSLSYYNSYLPTIAPKNLQDKVSALGFSYGYVGSVIMLIINLIVILNMKDTQLGCKLSFLMVGMWWFGFSIYSFYKLPKDQIKTEKFTLSILYSGTKETLNTFKLFKKHNKVYLYLIAFFLYSAGIQTIMYLATKFGTSELKLEEKQMIPVVLIIQIIAILGATILSRISQKIGNISTLSFCCLIWIGICIGAYFTTNFEEFCILAVVVGFMMGGVQSLSRSTFSKLLPKELQTVSSFSFYEFTEKASIVLGTVSFGVINQISGGMRQSIIALIIYFILSIAMFVYLLKSNFKKSD